MRHVDFGAFHPAMAARSGVRRSKSGSAGSPLASFHPVLAQRVQAQGTKAPASLGRTTCGEGMRSGFDPMSDPPRLPDVFYGPDGESSAAAGSFKPPVVLPAPWGWPPIVIWRDQEICLRGRFTGVACWTAFGIVGEMAVYDESQPCDVWSVCIDNTVIELVEGAPH